MKRKREEPGLKANESPREDLRGVHRGQTSEADSVCLFQEKSFTLTWKHQ